MNTDYLVREGDKVLRLSKGDMNTIVDALKYYRARISDEVHLFNEEKMVSNFMYLEYMQELRDLLNRLE